MGCASRTTRISFPSSVAFPERVVRRADAWLERHFGFWPLAIRFNYRHGFHVERMAHGHGNPFLDLDHTDPLPRWRWVERAMLRWYFSTRRYVPSALVKRMREECDAVVVANLQTPSVAPVLNAARAAGDDRRRLRRQLGPPGGQRRHLVPPRRVHRPERRHAGRSRALPRRRSGSRDRHRLAAERLLPRTPPGRGLPGAGAATRAGSVPSRRARDGQHADEHALRATVLRTAAGLVGGERRAAAVLVAVPPASPRQEVGAAVRGRRWVERERPCSPPARRTCARSP